MYYFYTEEELEEIRKAVIKMNEKAREIAKTRGYRIAHRIKAANHT